MAAQDLGISEGVKSAKGPNKSSVQDGKETSLPFLAAIQEKWPPRGRDQCRTQAVAGGQRIVSN